MIHLLTLAAAMLLHLQDPTGDAVGDGTLTPPTAPVYANLADFDLQSVSIEDSAKLTVDVTMGALTNPGQLPNGFSNPVIEVYLDTGRGGSEQLLPGSGMVMPPNHGWNVALRATGDQAYAVRAETSGSPGSWPRLPVKVDLRGNTIVLQTSLPRPSHAEAYAIVGVYDPFTRDGWRPLSKTVSPWAFSSPTQHVPVVDLLASTEAAQRREIDSGMLLPYRSPTHGVGWLLLMVLGLVTAAAGLVLRRRVRAPQPAPVGTGAAVDDEGRTPGGAGGPAEGEASGAAAGGAGAPAEADAAGVGAAVADAEQGTAAEAEDGRSSAEGEDPERKGASESDGTESDGTEPDDDAAAPGAGVAQGGRAATAGLALPEGAERSFLEDAGETDAQLWPPEAGARDVRGDDGQAEVDSLEDAGRRDETAHDETERDETGREAPDARRPSEP